MYQSLRLMFSCYNTRKDQYENVLVPYATLVSWSCQEARCTIGSELIDASLLDDRERSKVPAKAG